MNPQVTLSSTIAWTAVPSATSYVIASQDSAGTPILAETNVGTDLSRPFTDFVPVPVIGETFQLFVKAIIDTNADGTPEEVGPWGQLNVDVVGQLTASSLSVT